MCSRAEMDHGREIRPKEMRPQKVTGEKIDVTTRGRNKDNVVFHVFLVILSLFNL